MEKGADKKLVERENVGGRRNILRVRKRESECGKA